MKRRILPIILFSGFLLSGCKFTEVPSGVYTGTYTKTSWSATDTLPVSSGTGTLTLTDAGNNKVNAVFTSPGNPDVVANNLQLTRRSFGFYGTDFELYSSDYNSYYEQGTGGYIYEYNSDDLMEITFNNFDTLGFIFTGNKHK